MKSNADDCHLLVSSNEKVIIKIGSHEIAKTKREKPFRAHLERDCHLIIIYQRFAEKQIVKICALARVTSGMSLSKKHTLMNAFLQLTV